MIEDQAVRDVEPVRSTWVTRKGIHVNRTATAWLIRLFIDPGARIIFVEPGEVAAVQADKKATGFDAPGAQYPHKDSRGRCSFEQIVDERFGRNLALLRLARIVHGADFPMEAQTEPESAGLRAISQGFTDVAKDDEEIVRKASFLYDALYSHLKREEHASGPPQLGLDDVGVKK